VFLEKFKDIQETLLACPTAPCAAPSNAGNADIKGAELEVEAHPFAGLTLEGSFSKLDFKFTRIDPATGIPPDADAAGLVKNKFSLAVQYEKRLANGATITPRFDYAHRGGYHGAAIPGPGDYVDAFGVANARITWKSADDSLQVAAIATNLFDKYYFFSKFDLTALGGGSNYGFVAPPREYSVQIQKKF
jgi:iron complex outermembrane receptor protein